MEILLVIIFADTQVSKRVILSSKYIYMFCEWSCHYWGTDFSCVSEFIWLHKTSIINANILTTGLQFSSGQTSQAWVLY